MNFHRKEFECFEKKTEKNNIKVLNAQGFSFGPSHLLAIKQNCCYLAVVLNLNQSSFGVLPL